MKELRLSNSTKVATLDDEDLEAVLKLNRTWHLTGSGYAATNVRKNSSSFTLVSLHRFVLQLANSRNGFDVDHIDGNKLNNSKSNLRTVTRAENMANCKKRSGKYTSKFKGVSWHRLGKRWMVQVSRGGNKAYGGLFYSELEAAKKANELLVKLYGEFAVLNQI